MISVRKPVSRKRGLTLIELLMVLLLVTVLSGLALQSLPTIWESSLRAQYQRNAQEIASIFASAKAAGVDFTVPGDKRATVDKVVAGDTATTGVFKDKVFRLSGVSDDAIVGAMDFLDFDGDILTYDQTGTP